MANISDAKGVYIFKFEKDNVEAVIEFIKLMQQELEKSEYATFLILNSKGISKTVVLNESYVDKDGKLVFEVPFNGYGRWSYLKNIEKTFDWLFEDGKNLDFFNKNKSNIEVKVVYTDFELGYELLQEAVGEIMVGTSLDKCFAYVNITAYYDITRENFEALGYDNWEDIFEVE